MRGGHSRKQLGGSKCGEKELAERSICPSREFQFYFFFLEGNEDPLKQKNEMTRCIFFRKCGD